ncbi:MAG TPA: carbohydrate-binding protein CenC, partial [Armatimonadota bacterium]|nr:carbohydrate-binding protein CenC [Armatimonadota bacterium]
MKEIYTSCLIQCVLISAFCIGPLFADQVPATITVNAQQTVGKVNPFVFGHNVEAGAYEWDNKRIFTRPETGDGLWNPATNKVVPEVVKMSKEIGMTMMRYPGGCLVHDFDWHEAVGPVADRPHFAFGVDEFIAYCRAVGAEPLMNVSDYIGTPQDAADLVEYLNAPADARHPWA